MPFNLLQAASLYPVNFLRNYARLAVRTPLLSMVDVDLVLSWSLSQALKQQDRWVMHAMFGGHAQQARAIYLVCMLSCACLCRPLLKHPGL